MADRFPSLEEFSEGQTDLKPTATGGDAGFLDDTDFLAREKAALGEDAAQFEAPPSSAARGVTVEDDDLLGGDADVLPPSGPSVGAPGGGTDSDEAAFQSSFPEVQSMTNEAVAPGGTITGVGLGPSFSSFSTYQPPPEETEPIREWRARRDADVSRRAALSADRKAATVSKAHADVDDYYEAYNKRVDKARERTRAEAEAFLASRENTAAGGTSWERIARLVDVSGKGSGGGAVGSGKARFRELLVELKKDEKAPGASGV